MNWEALLRKFIALALNHPLRHYDLGLPPKLSKFFLEKTEQVKVTYWGHNLN